MRQISLLFMSQNDINIYKQIQQKQSAIYKYVNDKSFLKNNNKFVEYKTHYIKIKVDDVIFDVLAKRILDVIKYSHSEVEKHGKQFRPEEQFDFVAEYSDYGKKDPYDILLNDIKKWMYYLDRTNNLDILNLCCFIPFKLLTNRHMWWNGNKRTALATCVNLLRHFKLYLSYSDNSGLSDDANDRWYSLFTKYVRDDDNPDSCVELNKQAYYEIYKKFYNDILLGIYFDVYSIQEVKDE